MCGFEQIGLKDKKKLTLIKTVISQIDAYAEVILSVSTYACSNCPPIDRKMEIVAKKAASSFSGSSITLNPPNMM